jgi:integrase/recombinase XerD
MKSIGNNGEWIMEFERLSENFLDHCRSKRLSDHTQRAYRQDLTDYGCWLKRQSVSSDFSRDAVFRWLLDLQDRGLAPSSIKRRLACLKVLCRWLEEEEKIATSPFHRLRMPPGRRRSRSGSWS